MRILYSLLPLFISIGPAQIKVFDGRVTKLFYGGHIKFQRDNGEKMKLKLSYIQFVSPYFQTKNSGARGEDLFNEVKSLILKKNLRVIVDHRRLKATLFDQEQNLNLQLLKRGLAMLSRENKYLSLIEKFNYEEAQRFAQTQQKQIWGDDWDYSPEDHELLLRKSGVKYLE